jgi:tetratricopeptide (TPR) repeat protein
LANSYRDAGHYENAIETYRKRINIGGWIEEIWYSHYRIGNCYMQMGEEERAICAWMQGYNAYPNRIENLFKIVEYYRVRGKNKIAYEFYLMADKSRKKYTNWSDYLFLERDIYDYKLDYEWTILGYYVNDKGEWTNDLIRSSMKILNYPHLEENIHKNVMNNYKFYVSSVSAGVKSDSTELWSNLLKDIGNNMGIDNVEFVSSTPSMTWLNRHLIVNVRYVNYRIDDKGGYVNRDQVRTINVIAIVDLGGEEIPKTMPKILNQFILDYDTSEDARYVGLEDVRLHVQDRILYYNANRGIKNGAMMVEHGKIDLKQKCCQDSVHLKRGDSMNGIEKNWVLFGDERVSSPKVVYSWSPLIIGSIANGDQFVETSKNTDVPACFKQLRGSTNGVKIDGDIWFFCHAVSYEDRRYYYHMVIVLDAVTYKVKKYTPFFTFHKEKVEYILGFSYFEMEDEILLGYSLYDKETKYVVLDKKYFDSMMYVDNKLKSS